MSRTKTLQRVLLTLVLGGIHHAMAASTGSAARSPATTRSSTSSFSLSSPLPYYYSKSLPPRLSWPQQIRRVLNCSGWLGSATRSDAANCTPYDRISGHPVFTVTTPWGSPYLSMEKKSELMESVTATEKTSTKNKQQDSSNQQQQQGDGLLGSTGSMSNSVADEQSDYRSVALYFMDPDDALSMHAEMKQIPSMADNDVRITTNSLGKALRQCSCLGRGLLTGLPPEPLTGQVPFDQGAILRYKIVPPRRQLYYAARCIGRERVGLCSDLPAEDADAVLRGNNALEYLNSSRRQLRAVSASNSQSKSGNNRNKAATTAPVSAKNKKTPMQLANAHMEGYLGIPVFYCPSMHRQVPWYKRFVAGSSRQEIPLFFNYEDLQATWHRMRSQRIVDDDKQKTKSSINTISQSRSSIMPNSPPDVEVFNLWDVLTSMDRRAHLHQQQTQHKRRAQAMGISASQSFLPTWLVEKAFTCQDALIKPFHRRWQSLHPAASSSTTLQDIVFVPSSRSIEFKQDISAKGNGKARLRPMR